MWKFRLTAMLLVLGVVVALPSRASDDWQDKLKEQFETKFKPTHRSLMGSIKEPGTVLVVQQEGLRVDKPAGVMTPTVVRDGKFSSLGGNGIIQGTTGKALKPGDKLYLYSVRVKEDRIDLILGTVDTFDVTEHGSTKSTQYNGALRFEFPQGYLEKATLADITAAVNPILRSEEDIAAAPAKTVKLGQSTDEVVAALGKPEKIVDLGGKVIYVYKDMKIIFHDGKVSDVE